MRILLFGNGERARVSLQRLVDEGETLVGVVTRDGGTDNNLANAAIKLGIPVVRPKNVNDPKFLTELNKFHSDCNLSITYDQIIRSPLIELAPHGFVNFHPGKLPKYRGRSTINWAIINGESEIGITAHYIDGGIDTGDIILQKTLPIAFTDYYSDVSQKIEAAFPDLVTETLKMIEQGRVHRTPQSAGSGTYYCRRENGDEWLDWSESSLSIYNKIRGIGEPGPGAQTIINDRFVVVWRACFEAKLPTYDATHGQVVNRIPGEGVHIKTGDSTLFVSCVQFAGEEKSVPDWKIGTRLGLNIPAYLLGLKADLETLRQQVNQGSNSGGGAKADFMETRD